MIRTRSTEQLDFPADFEQAARIAIAAPTARKQQNNESPAFLAGYRVACHELACVLRAMMIGTPPTAEELNQARLDGLALLDAQMKKAEKH